MVHQIVSPLGACIHSLHFRGAYAPSLSCYALRAFFNRLRPQSFVNRLRLPGFDDMPSLRPLSFVNGLRLPGLDEMPSLIRSGFLYLLPWYSSIQAGRSIRRRYQQSKTALFQMKWVCRKQQLPSLIFDPATTKLRPCNYLGIAWASHGNESCSPFQVE